MIGLKRGTVTLYPHQTEWDEQARRTIKQLKELFGELAVDIQHVGSTSIPNIAAKPILDFAVGIYDFKELEQLVPKLEKEGIRYPNSPHSCGGISGKRVAAADFFPGLFERTPASSKRV